MAVWQISMPPVYQPCMQIHMMCKLEEKQGLIALHKQRSIVQSRLKYVSTVVLMLSYMLQLRVDPSSFL